MSRDDIEATLAQGLPYILGFAPLISLACINSTLIQSMTARLEVSDVMALQA